MSTAPHLEHLWNCERTDVLKRENRTMMMAMMMMANWWQCPQCLNVLTLQHEPWHWLLVLRWTRWQMEDKLAPQNLTRRRKVQKNIWNWLKGKEFERNWPLISTSLLSLIKAMSFWYLAMEEIYFSIFDPIKKQSDRKTFQKYKKFSYRSGRLYSGWTIISKSVKS